jgi:hypothetical protein
MGRFQRLSDWLAPIVYLSGNWISRTGVFLVTAAVVFGILLLPASLGHPSGNPYFGILAFLILPAVFLGGLLLIPIGIAMKRRHGPSDTGPLHLTSANPEWMKLVRFLAVATVMNIAIAGYAAFGAVSYMDSNSFCGKACHVVMAPEHTALAAGSHAQVECVACHVGPGAAGFIKAKMGGIRQLAMLATNTYSRPIPGAADRMIPAKKRCQQCHSLVRQTDDKLVVLSRFNDDEQNTPATTVLAVHVSKIHSTHVDNLDCLECHNRPAHRFQSAEDGVDAAIAQGAIARELPFARKQGVAILQKPYATREIAAAQIPAAFADYYRQAYPDVASKNSAEIARAGAGLAAIYARNVYPDLKLGWNSHPSNLGHTEAPGCFRCHEGGAITQDCSACHNLLAVGEAAPQILKDLGMAGPP